MEPCLESHSRKLVTSLTETGAGFGLGNGLISLYQLDERSPAASSQPLLSAEPTQEIVPVTGANTAHEKGHWAQGEISRVRWHASRDVTLLSSPDRDGSPFLPAGLPLPALLAPDQVPLLHPVLGVLARWPSNHPTNSRDDGETAEIISGPLSNTGSLFQSHFAAKFFLPVCLFT